MLAERVVLGETGSQLEEEHLARYRYAMQFVKGKRVLDLACGSGYGSNMLLEAGAASVVGIDISPEAIERARAQYSTSNLEYQVGNAEDLAGVQTASFDTVVSFETIEHLPHDRKYLDEVKRVLKKGGEYIVSTPDPRPGPIKQRVTGKPDNPFHVREYTLGQLVRLLNENFQVREIMGQNFVNPWLCFLPVLIAVKSVCALFKNFGGQNFTYRAYYHGSGSSLQPEAGRFWPVARFWIVRCFKP